MTVRILGERVPDEGRERRSLQRFHLGGPPGRLVRRRPEEHRVELVHHRSLVDPARVEIATRVLAIEGRDGTVDVADDEAVRPRVHLRQGRSRLLDRPRGGGILDDAERPVLPALAPVAAHHDPDRGAECRAATCEALPDEELPEHPVDRLAPQPVSVRSVLATHGHRRERLAHDEARVVVRPRLVAVVAALRVVVHPAREAHPRLRPQGLAHPRRVVKPVVGERDVRTVPAHGVAGVVGHGEDDRRRRRAAAPGLPVRVDARDAALAVAERLVVGEGGAPVLHGLRRVARVLGHEVGEGAGDRGARPGVAVGPPSLGEGSGRALRLLADAQAGPWRRCRSPSPWPWRRGGEPR